jgi:hypothetical protein
MSGLAWIKRPGGYWVTASQPRFTIWHVGGRYVLDVNDEEHSTHGSFSAAACVAERMVQR